MPVQSQITLMAEEIKATNYTDDNIRTLEGVEHIRLRPGMYIGTLGNGDDPADGIYVLLKEVVDNSIPLLRSAWHFCSDNLLPQAQSLHREYR